MTPKERVLAQLHHEETDYLPYELGFDGDVFERVSEYFGGKGWWERVEIFFERPNPGTLSHSPPAATLNAAGTHTTDVYGCVWRVDRRPMHLEKPVLAEPDFDRLRFPTEEQVFPPGFDNDVRKKVQACPELFHMAQFGFGLFERTWALRGFENVLMDAAAEPDFFEELIRRVAEHHMMIVEHLVKLPLDAVFFSDDWGDQRGIILGPERWRKYLKPHLARMYQRTHQAGMATLSHCCGSVTDVIPDLIEIGLDCLQSVQPEAMDPYELKRRWGDRMTFFGGVGSQRLLPFGTPDEIRAEVRKLCREMGRGGGYILGLAKSFQPETPTLNAVAAIEEFLAQAGVSLA